jgi:hypothetical protein
MNDVGTYKVLYAYNNESNFLIIVIAIIKGWYVRFYVQMQFLRCYSKTF